MKQPLNLILLIAIFCTTSCTSCKKDVADNNGLPPATQEGKNTLGFLGVTLILWGLPKKVF